MNKQKLQYQEGYTSALVFGITIVVIVMLNFLVEYGRMLMTAQNIEEATTNSVRAGAAGYAKKLTSELKAAYEKAKEDSQEDLDKKIESEGLALSEDEMKQELEKLIKEKVSSQASTIQAQARSACRSTALDILNRYGIINQVVNCSDLDVKVEGDKRYNPVTPLGNSSKNFHRQASSKIYITQK